MVSLRNFFWAILFLSFLFSVVIVVYFGLSLSRTVADIYGRDCKNTTFWAAKNLQYILDVYYSDFIVKQNLQNIYFRLNNVEAVYFKKDKVFVYPEKNRKMLKIFKRCDNFNSEKVFKVPRGILVCYPLKEELASQFIGEPKKIGVFAILFKEGPYYQLERKWLFKIFLSFYLLLLVSGAGAWFVWWKVGADLSVFSQIIFRVNRFLESEKGDVEEFLSELKVLVKKITFSEFKSVGELIYKLVNRFVKLKERLEREAIEDQLTGLFNRNYLKKVEKGLLNLSKRERMPFSVAMIDIDDFKAVNDTFGHQKGDEVLRALGEIIKERIRTSDIPVRYGGEEFLILFLNTSKRGALSVLEDIKDRFSDLDFGIGRKVTFSGGIASFPEDLNDVSDISELIELADERLYKAKKEGKNKIVYE